MTTTFKKNTTSCVDLINYPQDVVFGHLKKVFKNDL